MRLVSLSEPQLSGYTGRTLDRPQLRGMAEFSDGYKCAFVFDPADDEPVTLMRHDGRGWTRNPRHSAARQGLLRPAADEAWSLAVIQAQAALSERHAWDSEREAYFRKAQAGEPLYEALATILAEGMTPQAVANARRVLGDAEGVGLRTFIIRDTEVPGVTTRARGVRWDDVLRDFEMRLPARPSVGRFSIVEADPA